MLTVAFSVFLVYWSERSEGITNQLASGWAQLGNSPRPEFKQEWTQWDIIKYLMVAIFLVSLPFLRHRAMRIALTISNAIYAVITLVHLILAAGFMFFGADPTYPFLAFCHACLIFAVLIAFRMGSGSSEWVELPPRDQKAESGPRE